MVKAKIVCGIDLGQASLSACLLRTDPDGTSSMEHRTFAMVHQDLVKLKDWLVGEGCQTVGMEATGIYWRPVHQVLEGHMKIVVGNAANMKGLKGRKTDKIDAVWIAKKVRDNEVIPSFIPSKETREVRDYARLRASLLKARAQIRQGILKLLNAAGVPLGNVLDDVFGVSGMGILQALAQGEVLWEHLERLLKGKAREHLGAMRAALEVPLSGAQRETLVFQLGRLARNSEEMAAVDAEINRRLESHQSVRLGLMTIPGIAEEASALLLAELGTDLTDFPDAGHFAAWLGLTPGSNQTGGKSKPAPTRKGNRYLRALMIECAHAAARTKGCWLTDKFHSVYPRMPYKKAIVVIAHKLALIVYHVIQDGAVYRDQRQDFETGPRKNHSLAQAIRLIQAKGGQVVLPEGFPEIRTRAYRKKNKEPNLNPPNA